MILITASQMKLSEIFVWNLLEIGTILQASWDPKTSHVQSYFGQGVMNYSSSGYDIYWLLDLMWVVHKNDEMNQMCHFTIKNSAKKLAQICRLLGLKNTFCNAMYSKKCHEVRLSDFCDVYVTWMDVKWAQWCGNVTCVSFYSWNKC